MTNPITPVNHCQQQLIKPYRLINDIELAWLQKKIQLALQEWNDTHALFPLSCKLSLAPTTTLNDDEWATAQLSQLSVIKHCLFGDNSNCFNHSAKTLFLKLLNTLFGTQLPDPKKDWFYTGSPSLTLTLRCINKTMALYLNPQWVLATLPSTHVNEKPVSTLQEALSSKRVQLQVELTPLRLKLTDVMQLNTGDVIKTDHPIHEPAYLSHQKKHLCNVDIGQSNSFKTIKITRKT